MSSDHVNQTRSADSSFSSKQPPPPYYEETPAAYPVKDDVHVAAVQPTFPEVIINNTFHKADYSAPLLVVTKLLQLMWSEHYVTSHIGILQGDS